MSFTNCNIYLMIFVINMLTHSAIYSVIHSYTFCPNCVHFTKEVQTIHNCNLFKSHLLFKDRLDVDFIGKEICTIKGKYFIHKNETELDEFAIFK